MGSGRTRVAAKTELTEEMKDQIIQAYWDGALFRDLVKTFHIGDVKLRALLKERNAKRKPPEPVEVPPPSKGQETEAARAARRKRAEELAARRLQAADLRRQGMTRKQIAEQMGVGLSTVKRWFQHLQQMEQQP